MVISLHRQEVALTAAEVCSASQIVFGPMLPGTNGNRQGQSGQFVVATYPAEIVASQGIREVNGAAVMAAEEQASAEGLDQTRQRLLHLMAEKQAALSEAAQLQHALAASQQHVAALVQHAEKHLGREADLRKKLLDAQEELLKRDQELRQGVQDLIAQRDALTAQRDALTTQRDALTAQRSALTAERDDALAHLSVLLPQRDNLLTQRDALVARWTKLRNSLPARIYLGIRKVLTLGKR